MKKQLYIFGRLDFALPTGVLGYSKDRAVETVQYDLLKKLPRTWNKKFRELEEKINDEEIHAVLVYLTTPLFLQASRTEYHEVWSAFLKIISGTKNLIICFEENINENFNYYDYGSEEYLTLAKLRKRIKTISGDLESLSAQISKYKKKEEEDWDPDFDALINKRMYLGVCRTFNNQESKKFNFQNLKLDFDRPFFEYGFGFGFFSCFCAKPD
ncbi:hypothetical protein, partial [Reichenbachiella sp. MALMAid0571]|uniref:hypothetical protein n=1 Tax=Reichenbachiella sp. MALMAid0571 TaxID=3143939 RepID=UPI0032DED24E